METITLGGGCFWCIETIFERVKGVHKVTSGYSGGNVVNPSYEQVCSGASNHAEVVEVEFDNTIIDLNTILTVFFGIHDPTTLNRQGDDIGSQYRSIILVRNHQQRLIAEKKIEVLNNSGQFKTGVVTQIVNFEQLYSAESYHQDYYQNNPDNSYCQLIVARKIQKFLSNYAYLLKETTE